MSNRRVRQLSLYFEPVAVKTALMLCDTAETREDIAREAFGGFRGPRMDDSDLLAMLMRVARTEARGWAGKRDIAKEEVVAFMATENVRQHRRK